MKQPRIVVSSLSLFGLMAISNLAQAQYWKPLPSTVSPSGDAPNVSALVPADAPSSTVYRSSDTHFLGVQGLMVLGSRLKESTGAAGFSFSPVGLSLVSHGTLEQPSDFIGMLSGLSLSIMGSTVPHPDTHQPAGVGGALQWDMWNSRNPYQNAEMAHCLKHAAFIGREMEECLLRPGMAMGAGFGRTLDRYSGWFNGEVFWGPHSLAGTVSITTGVEERKGLLTSGTAGMYTYYGYLPTSLSHLPYSLAGELGVSLSPLPDGRKEVDVTGAANVGLGLPYSLTLGVGLRRVPEFAPDTKDEVAPGWRGTFTLGWGFADASAAYYEAQRAASHPEP